MRLSRALSLLVLGAAACGDNSPVEPEGPETGVSDVVTSVGEDGSVAVTVPVDGDVLAMAFSVSTPQHGTVTGSGPVFMYHPGAQFTGTDSFRVTITRGSKSTFVPVFIHVGAVNDPPDASDDDFVTAEDKPLVIPTSAVIANDVDVDSTLTVVAVTDPDDDAFCVGLSPCHHSTVELDGQTITYRPYRNFHGDQTFTYTVSDGQFTSTARVIVHVTAVNDAPDAGNDVVGVDQDTTLVIDPATLLANDRDPDGETPFVNAVGNPTHGSVAIVEGQVVFTPAPGYAGDEAGFDYQISDGMLTSIAHVEVDVVPVTPPACDHDVCAAGCALPEDTNECTQLVCAHDAACCDAAWGPDCVDETVTYCGLVCP